MLAIEDSFSLDKNWKYPLDRHFLSVLLHTTAWPQVGNCGFGAINMANSWSVTSETWTDGLEGWNSDFDLDSKHQQVS